MKSYILQKAHTCVNLYTKINRWQATGLQVDSRARTMLATAIAESLAADFFQIPMEPDKMVKVQKMKAQRDRNTLYMAGQKYTQARSGPGY